MKFSKLLIVSFLTLFIFACEDEKDEATSAVNCASIMAELDSANEAFETSMSRADCDKVIEKAEELISCMPEGDEKTEMRSDLDEIKGVCSLL